MKAEIAIKLVRELRLYDSHACTRINHKSGWVIKQAVFPRVTRAEVRAADKEAGPAGPREVRRIWVKIKNLKSEQRSLSVRRLVFQLRRHPVKRLPTVVKLPSGCFMIYDGNHRATAAAMLGHKGLWCEQIRKLRSQGPRK